MRRDLYIIFQLGLSFFLVFSAFNSQGFIEIAVLRSLAKTQPETGITTNSGYYSLSIIYFVFTLSNLIAPPIISKIGPKWSMLIGALCYTSFMFGFLRLSAWSLYLLSAVLGFGAAILWTGNGVYLVRFSREGKMARNSGIMWTMLQSSLIAGALFLMFVLIKGDLVSSYRLVYTVFSAVSCLGCAVILLLPSAPPGSTDGQLDRLIEDADEDGITEDDTVVPIVPPAPTTNFLADFVHTFSLLKTPKMMMLSVCFLYSGAETTFYTGVYSACLAATSKLSKGNDALLAYNVLCMGAGQILGGLWFGMGCKSSAKYGRSGVIFFGMVINIIAFFLCFLNLPMESPLHNTSAPSYVEPSVVVALITGFLLGLADCCWNTQLYTLLGDLYKDANSSPAFALFKFFQSLSACISFYYGSMLLLHWQLLILAIGAAFGAVSFFTVRNSALVDDVRQAQLEPNGF